MTKKEALTRTRDTWRKYSRLHKDQIVCFDIYEIKHQFSKASGDYHYCSLCEFINNSRAWIEDEQRKTECTACPLYKFWGGSRTVKEFCPCEGHDESPYNKLRGLGKISNYTKYYRKLCMEISNAADKELKRLYHDMRHVVKEIGPNKFSDKW